MKKATHSKSDVVERVWNATVCSK